MEILKLTSKTYKRILKKTISAIREGKVIICPTDTVYGLLGLASNKKTVNNIFKIKKRSKNKSFPIFVKDLKTAKKFAKINKFQERFLKKVWPGKVTAILERTLLSPSGFGGQGKTKIYGVSEESIGLRIPKYKLINEILKKTNLPLIGTSANISGEKPSTKIKEILNQFKDEKILPDLVLDVGNLKKSKPSAIVDLSQKKIKIIRRGDIKIDKSKNLIEF